MPLQDKEVKTILKQMGIETPKLKIDFAKGDRVKVTSGPFFDFTASWTRSSGEGEGRALISIFGRETPSSSSSTRSKRSSDDTTAGLRAGRDRRGVRFGATLLCIAVVLHVHQLLSPLGDAAIGLYLHVAERLDHGSLPYLTAWEYKPPGLFALFALALRLAPTPTIAVQSLAIVASVASSLAVGRLADAACGRRSSGLGRVAALLALTLSVENEGHVGDAEVLLAPFVAWAIAIAVDGRISARGALGIGLLCAARCR